MKEQEYELKLIHVMKLFEYFSANIEKEGVDSKWSWLTYKNAELLSNPYNEIMNGLVDERKHEKYGEYSAKESELLGKYAVIKDGKVVTDSNRNPLIKEGMEQEFITALDALKAEYPEIVEIFNTKGAKNTEFLNKVCKLTLVGATLEEIPNAVPPIIVGILAQ